MKPNEKTTRRQVQVRLAEKMRAMAHPVRLQMLLGLCQQECHVDKIWRQLRISQPLASQHLHRLRRAGLVSAQRRGKQICYQVTDPQVKQLLEMLCQWVANSES
ncbi:MAG: metalloregulator ArsR/SmtB family transcription factor [candidate division FCPU426 bacterium]